MKTNVYEFIVRVVGVGTTPEDAWENLLSNKTFHFDDGDYSIPEPADIKLIKEGK